MNRDDDDDDVDVDVDAGVSEEDSMFGNLG
jgi:hypothetical protein